MARLTQQQVESWITQNGGAGGVQYNVEQKQIRNPSPDPTEQVMHPYVTIQVEVWRNSKTGAELTVQRTAEGDFDQVESKAADPNKPAPSAERPQTVATSTTEPSIVTRNPDGTITTTPNPNYKPPEQKPTYITAQDGTIYEVLPGKDPRVIAQGAKPGQTVAVNGGKTLLFVGPDGQTRVAWQSEQANEDAQYNPNTGQYEVVTKDPNGRVTGVRAVPVTGQAPKKPGPALPTMVYGMTEAAIRQYADQLNAAVAAGDMTPAERDKRMAEAFKTAELANNEAVVVQRQQESSLNARTNLATTRYANEMDGLNNALSFVSKLNATLPEGSPLGGQAFAALLGMQAIARKRSGIDDISIPGAPMSAQGQQIAAGAATATSTANAEISRLTNPANAQAVAADRAAVQAQLAAAQAPPPAPAAPAFAPPPAVSSAAPARPTAPGAVPAPAAPPYNPAVNSETGEPISTAIPPSELGQPGDPGYQDQAPIFAPRAGNVQAAATPPPPPTADPTVTDVNYQQPQYPPYQYGVSPGPDPASYGGGEDMQRAPLAPAEYPVLAPYQPSTGAPMMSMAPESEPGSGSAYPVLSQYRPPAASPQATPDMAAAYPAPLQSEAASRPPWRMNEDELNRYRAAGIPDDVILSIPGYAA